MVSGALPQTNPAIVTECSSAATMLLQMFVWEFLSSSDILVLIAFLSMTSCLRNTRCHEKLIKLIPYVANHHIRHNADM